MNSKKYFLLINLLFLSFLNSYSMDSFFKKISLLSQVIKSGDVEEFERRMNSGISSNHKFFGNEALIVYIVKESQYEILKSLLKFNSLRSEKIDRDDIFNAFELCYKKSLYKFVELILKNTKCKLGSFDYEDIIVLVLQKDELEIFKMCVENYWIDINQHIKCFSKIDSLQCKTGFAYQDDIDQYNILTQAIFHKSVKIIKYLLSKPGIDMNTYKPDHHCYRDKCMNNLALACVLANDQVMKLFLEHPQSNFSEALSFLESNKNHKHDVKDAIKTLRKSKSRSGMFLLMPTIATGDSLPEFFDPEIKDEEGNNIMHLALFNENYKLYKDIQEKHPHLSTEFNLESQYPNDLLVERFVSIIKLKNLKALKEIMLQVKFRNLKDFNGDTILHHVIMSGDLDIIKIFLRFILLYNPQLLFVKNKQGQTPIHKAIVSKDLKANKNVLEFLIEFVYENSEIQIPKKVKRKKLLKS